MSTPTPPPNPYLGLTQEQVLTTMRKLLADEERNPFLMGQLHNYVADSHLLEGTRYKTAADFFCDNLQGISRTTLLRDAAVAREFNQEAIARFGVTRLQQLLAYKEATRITLNHAELGSTFIVVPQDNGDLKPKRFAGCSTKELRKALEHARSPGSYLPVSATDRAHYEQLREAIVSRFPKVGVLMRNHEGTTLMDFERIPLSEAYEFLALLREVSKELKEQPKDEEEPPQSH